MSKSIFLVTSEKYNDFFYLLDNSAYKFSDFERFAFACENLPLMCGSEFRKEFLSSLCEDLGESVCAEDLAGREVQKKLWRALNGVGTFSIKSPQKDASKIIFSKKEIPNLFDLFSSINTFNNLASLIENIDDLLLDLSDFEYCRPDKYHAEITFDKLLRGDIYENKEKSALLIWILSSSLMKKNHAVYLIYDGNISKVKTVVEYLEALKLFPPLYVCIKKLTPQSALEIAKLCIKSKEKNISPLIAVNEENMDKNFDEGILRLFEKIPSARIFLDSNKEQQGRITYLLKIAMGEK